MELEIIQELEKVKNEVLRKIGRNILLFQQIEHMFKSILSFGFSGFISEIPKLQENKTVIIQKSTLGQLAGQFFENNKYKAEAEEEIIELEEVKEAHLSVSFKIDYADDYEKRKQIIESIVSDRNELVHHLLPKINLNSVESWIETEKYLDKQYEKIIPEFEHLKSIIESIKKQIEIIKSDEFSRQFELAWTKQSPLVLFLIEISAQAKESEGWILLNTAGQLIHQYEPEEINTLNTKYGHKTLKKLILASEIFEIKEEITATGGIRIFYRLKPDLL